MWPLDSYITIAARPTTAAAKAPKLDTAETEAPFLGVADAVGDVVVDDCVPDGD